MAAQKTPGQTSSLNLLLNRGWAGLIYAVFALALLLLAALQIGQQFMQETLALGLLVLLLIGAPVTGLLIGRPPSARSRTLGLLVLLYDAGVALAVVLVTGGYASPLWVGLLLFSTAAPLLLPSRQSTLLLAGVWAASLLLLLAAPPADLVPWAMTWALRAAGVALVAVGLRRALSTEEGLRIRAERRERVLHDFLQLSNRLRVTTEPETILEEVARAVQASGDFDCVTLSRVDWRDGTSTLAVAVGARGERLTAVQGLTLPWSNLAPLLSEQQQVTAGVYTAELLPFRSIKHERHLILPLSSQFAEVHGLLTVSCAQGRREALEEAHSMLVLLANQAAAALDNSMLFTTMERRIEEATTTITQGQRDLAFARDRAETLYQIGRALASSLDEREVLTQALPLLAMATGAESAAILLSDPISGKLTARTTFDRQGNNISARLERGREVAGLVLANRRPATIPDTWNDTRWRGQPGRDEGVRSVLAAPLLQDDEPRGTILLTHPEPEHFRPEHGQLMLAAGNQIAVALSKAQLYRYVTEQSEQLTVTLQQREEEISKSQAILRSIGDGVVVSDRLGRIRMINPAAEEIINVDGESYLGRLTGDLPGAPERSSNTSHIDRVQIGGRILHAHYTPVLSAGGELHGSVIVYHDITREAMTDRLKSEFIATASHELRTPLTSIRGYVDLLLMGTFGQLTQAQSDFLKIVKNNVGRLVDLIDDLLDMSKVEAGEVRLRREQVSVAEVAYEVCETLYAQFTERTISIAIDVADNLPSITADRQRLRQIILNLVSNACKYTTNGGHVDLVVSHDEREVRVDVRDTGVGIPEEAQQFIFTPFFRADNPLRDAAGGTGLGLSITKTLIDLHGGRIWFESKVDEGSTFSFALPIKQEEWKPAEWLAEKV